MAAVSLRFGGLGSLRTGRRAAYLCAKAGHLFFERFNAAALRRGRCCLFCTRGAHGAYYIGNLQADNNQKRQQNTYDIPGHAL